MAKGVELKLNIDQFKKEIVNSLAQYQGRIGVLSREQHANSAKSYSEDGLTNAELAAVHEFGSLEGNIPPRSFFRLTEIVKGKAMADFVKSQEHNILKRILNGQAKLVIEKLSIKWEAFIHECFETEGFGTWQKLSDITLKMREKKRKDKTQGGVQILQDTGAMERSIISEVTKNAT